MMLDDFSIPEFEAMMINVDDIFLAQLFDYYHQQLVSNPKVYKQLVTLGLTESTIVNGKFGYCNRTLNRTVERSVTIDGAAFRGCMQRLALIKRTGHELFRGCVVEPVFNQSGEIVAACGIKCAERIRRNAPHVIYWYRQEVYTELMTFKLTLLGEQYAD